MKLTITTQLTQREYRHLRRQRGQLRLRKIDNSPMSPRARYWSNWQDIRDDWEYMRCGKWQEQTVRRAYALNIQNMRKIRLGNK